MLRGDIDIVVVDGPNLFNAVAPRIDLEAPVLRLYLTECFDVDLFALASIHGDSRPAMMLAYPRLGTVIFHSKRSLGREPYRLSDQETESFWARQGGNPNTSTFCVDVPGDQQETYSFQCDACGHSNEAHTRAEKGIDTSIATYLMETAESWQSACLFSRDTDYAPLIAALRRKGKMVFVAVPEDEKATALVRIAQSTFHLNFPFLEQDICVSRYLMQGGVLDGLTEALSDEPDMEFAVDVNSENSLSLGITHPESAKSRVRAIVETHLLLLQVPGIAKPMVVEHRNSRLLVLKLPLEEVVQRRLGKFSMNAGWRGHRGNIFNLYRQIVERG